MRSCITPIVALILAICTSAMVRHAQADQQSNNDEAATSSLYVTTPIMVPPSSGSSEPPSPLRAVSLFAIAIPKPHVYQEHDLVQIIVRETSQATSTADLNTKKNYKLAGQVNNWPDFNLHDLLNLSLHAGDNSNAPKVDLSFDNTYKGQSDYERKDDLTARITAEIIQVLPNGNVVLEARTSIKTDSESLTMKVTGTCRPADISSANTVLSNQVFDLSIDKASKGELRKTTDKGILAKILDTIFAF